MTTEQLIPIHREVCKLDGVTNIELGETLTFEKNGCKWEVFYIAPENALSWQSPFELHKNGERIFSFVVPQRLKIFFKND